MRKAAFCSGSGLGAAAAAFVATFSIVALAAGSAGGTVGLSDMLMWERICGRAAKHRVSPKSCRGRRRGKASVVARLARPSTFCTKAIYTSDCCTRVQAILHELNTRVFSRFSSSLTVCIFLPQYHSLSRTCHAIIKPRPLEPTPKWHVQLWQQQHGGCASAYSYSYR
jgi:hypothetical protein